MVSMATVDSRTYITNSGAELARKLRRIVHGYEREQLLDLLVQVEIDARQGGINNGLANAKRKRTLEGGE